MEMTHKPPAKQHHHAVVKEIMVDASLVGLILGKQGNQIKRVSEQYNVMISVDNRSGGDKRKIII
jgi:hypothetical protein